jgi:hypothetical protein
MYILGVAVMSIMNKTIPVVLQMAIMAVVQFTAFWTFLAFNLVLGQQQSVLRYNLDYDFNQTNFQPSDLYIKIPNFINAEYVSSGKPKTHL